MKKIAYACLVTLVFAGPALARPTRTSPGPGSYSTSGTSRRGESYESSSSVTPTRNGVNATGNFNASGAKGGTASGSRTYEGNAQTGQGQGSAQWSTPKGTSGSVNGQVQVQNGTKSGSADWTRTNQNGETNTGTVDANYNSETGGTATVNSTKGSKTVTLLPRSTATPTTTP